MQPIYTKKVLTAASANAICTSQTPGGAGNLTLTASPVVLDAQRRVLFTFAGNEAGHNFVVYGTDSQGISFQESVAGTGIGTVATTQNFKTVTRISIDAAAAGAIQVGTNGVGSSAWKIPNWHISPFQIGIACVVSGTVNYTVELTYQDPSGNYPDPNQTFPLAFNHPSLVSSATSLTGSIMEPCAAYRITVNSGTGSVDMQSIQAGISG